MNNVTQSGWWKRHWKWSVPVAGLAALIAYAYVNGANRLDTAWTVASRRATHDPGVIAVLGEPIHANLVTSTVSGSSTSVRINGIEVNHRGAYDQMVLKMQLVGPKGEAKLSAKAVPALVGWDFQQLAVETPDNTRRIDLLRQSVP